MARLFVLGWMVLLASGSPARAGGGSCPYDTGSGPLVWQDREPGIRYATFAHPGKGTELPKVFAHLLSVSLDAGLQPIAMRPLGGGLRLEQMVKVLTGGRGLDIRAGLNGDYFSFGDRVKDPLGLFITRGQLLRFPSGTSSLLYDAEGRMHMGIFSVEQEVRWDGGAITVDAANDVDAARRDAAVLFSGVYSDEVKGLKGCWVVQGRAGALEPMINRTLSYDVMDSGYRSGVKDLQERDLVQVACGAKGQAARTLEKGGAFTVSTRLVGLADRVVMEGISGGPRILRDGVAGQEAEREGFSLPMRLYIPQRHPRSGVGISADGRTLFLLAVEGRGIRRSAGMNATHAGCLLGLAGASEGMLFDGGGSAVLMYDGAFLNAPHKGRDYTARDLANALGVVRTP